MFFSPTVLLAFCSLSVRPSLCHHPGRRGDSPALGLPVLLQQFGPVPRPRLMLPVMLGLGQSTWTSCHVQRALEFMAPRVCGFSLSTTPPRLALLCPRPRPPQSCLLRSPCSLTDLCPNVEVVFPVSLCTGRNVTPSYSVRLALLKPSGSLDLRSLENIKQCSVLLFIPYGSYQCIFKHFQQELKQRSFEGFWFFY